MLLSAFLALAPVAASPLVYLDCTIQQQGRPVEWKITLNEAQGNVDHETAVSGAQRRPARFTAEQVYFIGFTLSRVDLTINRVSDVLGEIRHDTGACRLATPKERAF